MNWEFKHSHISDLLRFGTSTQRTNADAIIANMNSCICVPHKLKSIKLEIKRTHTVRRASSRTRGLILCASAMQLCIAQSPQREQLARTPSHHRRGPNTPSQVSLSLRGEKGGLSSTSHFSAMIVNRDGCRFENRDVKKLWIWCRRMKKRKKNKNKKRANSLWKWVCC